MRKYLLLTLMMLMTVVAKAEYNTTYSYSADYDYPEITGAGTWEVDTLVSDSYSYIWLKYTPTEDVVFKRTASSASISVYGPYTDGSGVSSIRFSYVYDLSSSTATYYDVLTADNTYYIRVYANSTSATFTWEEVEDITYLLGSEDDPAEIEADKTYFIGDPNCYSYSYPYSYATFTAPDDLSSEENNMLNLQFGYNVNSNVVNITCGDSTWTASVSSYQAGFLIEAGKTYELNWSSAYLPYLEVSITHPATGSLDIPYTLALGENEAIVPAEAGTYYYTFNPGGNTGYYTLAGESDASNTVSVYYSKSSATSSYASYFMEASGSYDCTWEVSDYYSSNDWFLVLEKTVATDAAETLTLSYREYVAGETADNPIVIDTLAFTDTLSQTNGTFYYSFTAPESWTDNTLLKYSRANGSDDYAVEFWIYDSSYNTSSWTYDASLNVEGLTAGTTYTIQFTVSDQTEPIIFTVDSAASEAGDFISNPLNAYDGDNILTKSGSVYYQYEATQTGKFEMDVHESNIGATFPTYAGSYYDYDWTLNGSVYSMEVEEGTTYLICITGAEVGDTFTISYGEYAAGEAMSTAINVNELPETTYHLSEANGLSNIWLQYTMTKDGGLTIDGTSIDYNWYNYAYIYTPGSEYASYMEEYDYDTYSYKYYYDGSFSEGDTIYVNLQISYWSDCEGDSLIFTERDYKDGEMPSKAITIETNVADTITLDATPSSSPVWFKFDVPKAGDVTVNVGYYTYYNLYAGIEEAESNTDTWAETTGTKSTVALPDGTEATMYAYTTSTDTAVTYYMYMDYCYYTEIPFYIVVPDTVLADITITANTPEDEGEVEELSEIILDVDFEDWVLDVDSAMAYVTLYSKLGGIYAIDTITKNDEGQLVITTDIITDEVSLTLSIPEGILGNSRYVSSGHIDGHTNAVAVFYYDVAPAAEEVEYEWISEPADSSTVELLDTIVVYIGDKSTTLSYTWNVNPIIVCGSDTTTISNDLIEAKWDTDWSTYTYSWIEIVLADSITTAGDYTLVFPVGSLTVEDKDYEEEVSFFWTVTGITSSDDSSSTDDSTNGISNIKATVDYLTGDVYTLSGMRVKNVENLPAGIYIVNGKKIVVK